MDRHKLIVRDGSLPKSIEPNAGIEVITHAEFASRARNGSWLKKIGAYREVGMITPHMWLRPSPFLVITVLRMLSRGSCWLQDSEGRSTTIEASLILRRGLALLLDWLKMPFLLRRARGEVRTLLLWVQDRTPGRLQIAESPIYLKTDLWFSTQVGGSVTHMAGVVNHLHEFLGQPVVFSTVRNPLLSPDIVWKQILPELGYWDFREIPALMFSRSACGMIQAGLDGMRPSFIYQRYSLNNYAAVLLTKDLAVPLVTEYNGSEVWIGKHWGKPAVLGELSSQIEMLNLTASDLVVVVSNVLREELVARGILEQKILVNPNGVDTEFFKPTIDSAGLRETLGLSGKIVIGFIGTFGPWHGVEVLIKAFSMLMLHDSDDRNSLHLLMVGDGVRLAESRRLAQELGVEGNCTFTGLVSQIEGPRYLACCDILAAPHVPNADGTEFFGSPTKLFEYMAMGRAIVASRLGQIGDVLEHGHTGWLVEPGNTAALAEGLSVLLQDARLRAALGMVARNEVVRQYSWRKHVERIASALKEICA